MPKIVGASQARAELFRLMDEVVEFPEQTVLIQRRGREERVALVREGRLRFLETCLAALEARQPSKPFQLIGSLKVEGDVEEVIREGREEQNRLFDEKFKDL